MLQCNEFYFATALLMICMPYPCWDALNAIAAISRVVCQNDIIMEQSDIYPCIVTLMTW